MAATVTAAAIAFCSAQGADLRDDFNDGNDDGWSRYEPLAPVGAPGVFSLENGAYRIQALASPNPGGLGPATAGSFRGDLNLPDFDISFDLADWNNNINQSFGVIGRASDLGLNTAQGYLFTYSTSGFINLSLLNNGFLSVLATAPVVLDPMKSYHFSLSGIGRVLIGRVFESPILSSPIALAGASDSTLSSGITGLYVFSNDSQGTADAAFDNFRAFSNIPEPSVWSLIAIGCAVCIYAAKRRKGR